MKKLENLLTRKFILAILLSGLILLIDISPEQKLEFLTWIYVSFAGANALEGIISKKK